MFSTKSRCYCFSSVSFPYHNTLSVSNAQIYVQKEHRLSFGGVSLFLLFFWLFKISHRWRLLFSFKLQLWERFLLLIIYLIILFDLLEHRLAISYFVRRNKHPLFFNSVSWWLSCRRGFWWWLFISWAQHIDSRLVFFSDKVLLFQVGFVQIWFESTFLHFLLFEGLSLFIIWFFFLVQVDRLAISTFRTNFRVIRIQLGFTLVSKQRLTH